MTNEEKIWYFLKDDVFDGNEYAAAGMEGNLYAESALNPKNLQQTFEKKLGMNDDQYVEAVDSGRYTSDQFINDKAGFGLAQWTYWTRKKGLKEFADWQNLSIGDLGMQLEYLKKELKQDYASLLKQLKACTNVKQASDLVLTQFERPADQGTSVQLLRAAYSKDYYDKYAGKAKPVVSAPVQETKTETPVNTSGRYNSVEEMPSHYHEEMNEIKSKIKIGRGKDNTILDLSEDMVRILILCYRLIKAMLGK